MNGKRLVVRFHHFIVMIVFFSVLPVTGWGGDWRTELLDTGGDWPWTPSLALDASDQAHIAYVIYSGSDEELKYAWQEGGSWQFEIIDSGEWIGDVSLAQDSSGNPHIAYLSDETLKHAWHDGNIWHIETVDSDHVGGDASLVLDSNDRPHIAYYYYDWDLEIGRLRYAWKEGGSWYLETVESGGDVGDHASLALDAGDRPHIAYEDDNNDKLRYAWHDGSSWHRETVDADVGVGAASLALDSGGNPHVAYRDHGGDVLKYARKDGGSWHWEVVDNLKDGAVSLALDANDHPHISYTGYIGYPGLKYAYKGGASWVSRLVDGGVESSSLALDANQAPRIAYYDIDGNLKYVQASDINAPICLEISTSGNGLVMGAGLHGELDGQCANAFSEYRGAQLTLVAEPFPGEEFTGWAGDCGLCAGSPACLLAFYEDARCTALFTSNQGDPETLLSYLYAAPDAGVSPHTVAFQCRAHDPAGTVLEYRWDFDGDGVIDETTEGETTTHTYGAVGSYDAICTVVGEGGTTATSSPRTVLVGNRLWVLNDFTIFWHSPDANYDTVSKVLLNVVGSLLGEARNVGLPINNLNVLPSDDPQYFPPWTTIPFDIIGDNGDIDPALGGQYGYFSAPGEAYRLSDEAVLEGDRVTRTITRLFGSTWATPNQQPPVIDAFTADPTSGVAPLTVDFTCPAHDPDGGDIVSIEWYFGDSQWPHLTVHNDFTNSHVYEDPGTYVAHCVVWDDEDENATSENVTITVNAPVTYHGLHVEVTPEDGTGGTVTSGNEEISCPDDCSATYEAGAGVTLVAAPAEGYLFAGWGGACEACGTGGSCLLVMDADKTCGARFEPVPNQPPVIDGFTVTPTSGEAPLAVTASCHASDPDGSISTYRFDAGDGTGVVESGDGSFNHTYATAGSYGATCTAVDNDGAEATSEPVTVSVAAPRPVWQDVTGSIEVSRSRTLYDRINRSFFVLLDLVNGGSELRGPVRMVLRNATLPLKASAPGLDPDGYTDAGDPYFLLVPAGGTWAAGAALEDVRLDFVLQRKRLDFDLKFEQLR